MKRHFRYIAIGIVLILIFFLLPRLILGTDSYINIHDNLDGPYGSLTHILGENPGFFVNLHLNVFDVLTVLFSPIIALIINDVAVHITAFIGMFLLLQRHILPEEKDSFIIFGASLCFAFLPFYSRYGLSVAGMPLLACAFLNLRKNKWSISDYAIIFIFPFYSSLVLTGVFIIAVLGIVFIYDLITIKRVNKCFLYGLVLLTVLYAIVEYNLIYMFFLSKSYISHRAAWNPYYLPFALPTGKLIIQFIKNVFVGQYHAASLHTPIIFLSVILIILIKDKKKLKYIYVLLLLTVLFSFLYCVQSWYLFVVLKEKIQILKIFNFGRFHWLHPLIWYVLFAICLSYIKDYKYSNVIIPLVILFQLAFVIISPFQAKQELKYNIVRMFNQKRFTSTKMTFKEFYSEDLFKEINDYIGKDNSTYRIGCIGFHPAIAQFNGFYTLDVYLTNYPLEYKIRFRRIISKELDKSPINKSYFDDWGNRCYFFIHDLKRNSVNNIKTSKLQESELDLDIKEFNQMGGKYLFSTVKIINYNQINLKYLKTFEKTSLPWRIHLYQVNL